MRSKNPIQRSPGLNTTLHPDEQLALMKTYNSSNENFCQGLTTGPNRVCFVESMVGTSIGGGEEEEFKLVHIYI